MTKPISPGVKISSRYNKKLNIPIWLLDSIECYLYKSCYILLILHAYHFE